MIRCPPRRLLIRLQKVDDLFGFCRRLRSTAALSFTHPIKYRPLVGLKLHANHFLKFSLCIEKDFYSFETLLVSSPRERGSYVVLVIHCSSIGMVCAISCGQITFRMHGETYLTLLKTRFNTVHHHMITLMSLSRSYCFVLLMVIRSFLTRTKSS